MLLKESGHDAWIDRKNISIASVQLKETVASEMECKRLALICIGPGDLERCKDLDDFFRWEITHARQLEKEKKIKIIIIVHGTTTFEDLICETGSSGKLRKNALKSVGEWWKDSLEYLQSHYVLFFDFERSSEMVDHIVKELRNTDS